MGLEQKDIAKIFKVCEDSITGWENGRTNPMKRYHKSIIKFLGYVPN